MGLKDDQPIEGKDLQDFTKLPRKPVLAYLQKQVLPRSPRQRPPADFPYLAMFLPTNLWKWISEYVRYRIGPIHPFPDYTHQEQDTGVYPLESDEASAAGVIRVALAGDWGTGTDEAFKIGKRIEDFRRHYAIHLGDVYFVGDPNEVKANFLGIANPRDSFTPCCWPRGLNGTFALNGNHEMYARGYAYFQLILPRLGLNGAGAPSGQKASFFCLQNEFWRIIALDTGYDSIGIPFVEEFVQPYCALPDQLLEWLRDVVFHEEDSRGIVLLSHHQYYSCFDDWFTRQAEQMAAFISRPVIWFWGHEHRLAIYEKFQAGGGIEAYGRCIGHGGMPVDLPPATRLHSQCQVEFVDHRKYVSDEDLDVGINGFAQLTFAGNELAVDYVDIDGNTIFAESWRVDGDGNVERTAADALIGSA